MLLTVDRIGWSIGQDDGMVLRIGVLGAARIAPNAVIKPARSVEGVEVVAVAARDVARARAYAAKHGIPAVRDSYAELVADDGIDAVYNPLPNGLHGHWTIAALRAGKHVLCEKPFTANAAEAREVGAVAAETGLVTMEALHWRYHPLAQRMIEIVGSGELGELRDVRASVCFPLPLFSDIRYRFDLAGGALMDTGCYAVHMVRTLGGEPEVVSATAKLRGADVDRAMRAELRFPAGRTGRITCSLWSSDALTLSVRVVGDRGEMRVVNPMAPHAYHRLTVRSADGRRVEKLTRRPTYAFQLDAFAAAVAGDRPVVTDPAESVRNMAVIDSIYRAAGLPERQPTRVGPTP